MARRIARVSAACARGERDIVCRAEGVLRGFLIGKSVFELVVQDEGASDGRDDADTGEDQYGSGGVIFGEGGEVGGLIWRERYIGEDFDSAHKIGLRDRDPACEDLVLSCDVNGRGDGPEGDVGFGVEDGELKRRAGYGVDAAVIAGDVSNGSDVSKLEDKIGLFRGVDELIAAPGLQRRIDVVVGFGFVDGEVGVGARIGEKDGLGLLNLRWNGSVEGGVLGPSSRNSEGYQGESEADGFSN